MAKKKKKDPLTPSLRFELLVMAAVAAIIGLGFMVSVSGRPLF